MRLKYLIIPMVVVFALFAFAKAEHTSSFQVQTAENEQEVQKVIETFFEGFHKQDSTLIKKVVHENVMMQSIGKDKLGEVELSKQDFGTFLSSICAIPETTHFEERIASYEIKMDGKMANVWTPYAFYINGNLSHCGTNSFQLFKRNGVWKIFYIVDTRDREGCGKMRG
ncbi:nuclear transport factor 2 family protein [Dokdonia sinensis]|uniref:Nuclear transport factor 2 family protein n=1 Tax=Dokdonia sinensis TaxID=2479847 RepID=A0A3M0FWA1_9FLAO|nr:nuclear transport factor 2 family protein [Dokdonia sinensis]RMB56961.1 nuclear transport factor 2 family protein [Dokdonia sinensis]